MQSPAQPTAIRGVQPSAPVAAGCFTVWAVPAAWMGYWTPLYQAAFEQAQRQVAASNRRARLLGFSGPSLN